MKTIIIFTLLLFSNLSQAQPDDAEQPNNTAPPQLKGFIYGAGMAIQNQIYKGFDQRTIAIPVIGYVGEKLTVFGPFISYSLFEKNDWELDLNIAPRFNGFDDSDSDFFTGMQKRKDSIDAGVSIKYTPKQWRFVVKSLNDVLSNSNGSEFSLSVSRKHKLYGLSVEPSVSLNQIDSDFVDYYYGVRESEQTASRDFYQGRSTLNKTLGLTITGVIPVGLLQLDLNNTWYASGVTDSPLVDSDKAFSTRLTFIRFF